MLEELVLWQQIAAVLNAAGFMVMALGFAWMAYKLSQKADK
jgi:hypothetical protein